LLNVLLLLNMQVLDHPHLLASRASFLAMPHVLAMVTLHLQHIAFAAALLHISCQLEAKWWHWHRG
jgi:hypothetical protein